MLRESTVGKSSRHSRSLRNGGVSDTLASSNQTLFQSGLGEDFINTCSVEMPTPKLPSSFCHVIVRKLLPESRFSEAISQRNGKGLTDGLVKRSFPRACRGSNETATVASIGCSARQTYPELIET